MAGLLLQEGFGLTARLAMWRGRLALALCVGICGVPLLAQGPAKQRAPGQYYRARPVAKLPRAKLAPPLPQADVVEHAPDSSLADAIALAYRANPSLAAKRYDLRATDENLGLALSELRPTSQLQITGQYDKTVPGETSQANRLFATSPIITSNSLGAQLIVNQPLYTGGRASADISAANAAINAGRAGLLAAEGDLLLQTITAYLDVRRDAYTLAIRKGNLAQLAATLDEVKARREAGELTKTDIAQAEVQKNSAEAQYNLTRAQLEQSRASYAALVGVNPGVLAAEPPLPQLPGSVAAAFEQAEALNPDLAQARFAEAASRQKIAAARAANHPTLALQGTLGLNGQGVPFYLRNEDQSASLRGVLTIPLTSGGHNGAAIAQAEDTNSGDRLRIEAARRAMVYAISNAWNQMVTARRNLAIGAAQVQSARVFYEGSFEEYRAGLRSTFDVLYAQGTLRDAEIAEVNARRDVYIAEATLLRQIGLLEVRSLLTGVVAYDPVAHLAHVRRRGAMPWDVPVRAFDRMAKAGHGVRPLDPPLEQVAVQMAPVMGPPVPDDYISDSPITEPMPQGAR